MTEPRDVPQYFLYDQDQSGDGETATITFNRPEKRNPLDVEVMLEFESLVHRARDSGRVKVLVVTGNGPVFCAGADMSAGRSGGGEGDVARVPRIIGRVFDTMLHADMIVIGAINGHAVGGGWSIAAGFDHVVAVEDARFWLPEVEIGMPFRGLANIGLTQRLGPALAKEAMILCRKFSADELLRYRVINQVCGPDELEAETRRAIDAYLAMPWKAAMATRREINGAVYGPQYY